MTDSLDLIDGIATLIAANVPGAAYNPDGVYTAGQVGIFNMLLPATPDEVIVLTWVPQTQNPAEPSGTGLFQVRARGAANRPRRPIEILDQVADVLLGATHIPIGSTGAAIDQVRECVRAPMGMDDLKRWDWTDNYTLDMSYTPTVNRPAGGWD
ncbi:hypothetical protein [Humibacter sp.]|uniref:hypothetical protein n=1 Tax=Humibacter sp. TaxID=1940291 RepID=UPI003F7E9985